MSMHNARPLAWRLSLLIATALSLTLAGMGAAQPDPRRGGGRETAGGARGLTLTPAASFGEEVTVTATREERPVTEVPAAIAVIDERALAAGRAEALDTYLAAVPGVVAQPNDGASDVKLAIRGFGARSGFGVRDLLVLIDGVPITDADGFTRLDQIDRRRRSGWRWSRDRRARSTATPRSAASST